MTRPLPDLNRVKRLLIIRLSSIGDVTHALPVSAALGEAFPHLEITWIVEEMSAQIVLGNPCLHDVIVVPRSRWKQGRWRSPQVWREYLAFLRMLRRRRFEVTVDLQGYAKSAFMALATGAKHRFGWWRLRDGANLASRSLPRRPESVHRTDWFLDVARAFGAISEPVKFPLHVPEEARDRVRGLLEAEGIACGSPFAVLNPAVGDQTRRWGAERYAEVALELAKRFGMPSVLIGSGKDAAICDEVRTLAEQSESWPAKVVAPLSLAGQTDLKELAAVLAGCAVHICGDTGSVHIAAALGRPVVALYGPTDPLMAGPWGQSENVLSHRELCADGCTVRECVYTRPVGDAPAERAARCLAAITPGEVLRKVEEILYER